jgi:hypothetical protein
MAYPSTIDNFTTVNNGDTITDAMFNTPNAAIEALEAKVGVNSSSVDTSLDYKVNNFFVENIRKLYFYENTAPTGWLYESSVTDKVLAVKGGSQAYNTTGGNVAGTWTQPNHTLTTPQIPSHSHPSTIAPGSGAHTHDKSMRLSVNGSPSDDPVAAGGSSGGTMTTTSDGIHIHTITPGNTGGGGAHNHGTTYRPYAALGIIAKYTGS